MGSSYYERSLFIIQMGDIRGDPVAFQDEPKTIIWRLYLASPPTAVFDALNTARGRESFWADSAEERDGVISFEIGRYPRYDAQIIKRVRPDLFVLRYFDTNVTFELQPAGSGGTDLLLRAENVPDDARTEFIAGWVSLLLTMKAAVDHGVDLRNHDLSRTWMDGYADN